MTGMFLLHNALHKKIFIKPIEKTSKLLTFLYTGYKISAVRVNLSGHFSLYSFYFILIIINNNEIMKYVSKHLSHAALAIFHTIHLSLCGFSLTSL